MAAPTVTYIGASNFSDSVSTGEVITGGSWVAGDRILVLAMTEDQGETFGTPAASGLTFSALSGTPSATASSCKGYGWVATASGSGSGNITIASTSSTAHGGAVAWKISGSDGIGNVAVTTSNTKTNSLTRSGANSAVAWIGGDWSADTDVTVTASPVGGTQRVATNLAGIYTAFAFDWGDQGSAGSTSYGIANASGTGTITKIAVEILGAGGTDGSATSPAADAVADIPDPALSAGSTATSPTADATGVTPAPTLQAGATVTAPTLDAAGDIPAPTVSGGGWEDIGAATASSYLLDAADEGALIRCIVTATNAAGSVDATSDETGPVEPAAAGGTVTAPTLDATGALPAPSVVAGGTVTSPAAGATGDMPAPTVSNGTWEDISGATASSYLLDSADETLMVRCVVTATNVAGDTAKESNEVGPVDAADVGTDAEVVSPTLDATGDIPTPTLPISMEVTSGQLSATGDLPVPTVTGTTDATVTSPALDATGDMPVPAATAGSGVTSPTLDATGDLPVPSVQGSSAGEVAAPPLDATGALRVPAVSAGHTISAPPLDAIGGLPVPDGVGDPYLIMPAVGIGAETALATWRGTGDTTIPGFSQPVTGVVSVQAETMIVASAYAETELVLA